MNIKNNQTSGLAFGNAKIKPETNQPKPTSYELSAHDDKNFSKCSQAYFKGSKMSNINFKGDISSSDGEIINNTEQQIADLYRDKEREYYLFASAKLLDTFDSTSIYKKYPDLQTDETFNDIKNVYDKHPKEERTKRVFQNLLDAHIGGKLSEDSDKISNDEEKIVLDVSDLGLKDDDDKPVNEINYKDVSGWLQNTESNDTRKELSKKQNAAFNETLKEQKVEHFNKNTELMTKLGYPQQVDFYSNMSGHNLRHLSNIGSQIIDKTEDVYNKNMGEYFKTRTGKDFSEADRSDVAFVISGPDPAMKEIDSFFPEENLVPLAAKTFDGLGIEFSKMSKKVDYKSLDEYKKDAIENSDTETPRLLLDIAKRPGKDSRAYMTPVKIPSEIYLSVKPEGGLDDYEAFMHESGHSMHFAHSNPKNSFAQNILGNNTVTETYAYLFEKMLMNKHWLKNMAGLTDKQAKQVVKRQALSDLYMVRRYSGKMQFETNLYDQKANKEGKIDTTKAGELYSKTLTKSTGFKFPANKWVDDIDAGFYVADYFTAWTLEAQLKNHLEKNYGTKKNKGEDWYLNPKAGEFLKELWSEGNPGPKEIAKKIGSNDPNDPKELIKDINERFAD